MKIGTAPIHLFLFGLARCRECSACPSACSSLRTKGRSPAGPAEKVQPPDPLQQLHQSYSYLNQAICLFPPFLLGEIPPNVNPPPGKDVQDMHQ